MWFQQSYLNSLGHASYLIGDEKTGQALVFDPRRDVDVYRQAARDHDFRITYACDSHGHNDYLSGDCVSWPTPPGSLCGGNIGVEGGWSSAA